MTTTTYPAYSFTTKKRNRVTVYNVRAVVQTADNWTRRAQWVRSYAVVNDTVTLDCPAAYMAPRVVAAANY